MRRLQTIAFILIVTIKLYGQTPPVIGTITQPDCNVPTGSVVLSGLPDTGQWTLTQYPGPTTSTGTGTTTLVTGLAAGTSYTFTVTNESGGTSGLSNAAAINPQPSPPDAPSVGSITQPTCTEATGTIVVSAPLGTEYEYNIDNGAYQVSPEFNGILAGPHNIRVRNVADNTCISGQTPVLVNDPPITPAAPVTGTITQPNCTVATGSVVLNGLPSTGTWTVTKTPGGTISTGTGISTTISALTSGTYTFTVSDGSGCTSAASNNVVIASQPTTPTAPLVGAIIQPTCTISTGIVILNGLPSTGTWTLTITPGGTTSSGTGISTIISALPAGTYAFTVSNASGCTSTASNNIVIDLQPSTPSTPIVGTIAQPTCAVSTGSVVLSGLPSDGSWTLTRTPGGTTTPGTGTGTTVSNVPSGTFTYTVTNSSGCTSPASNDVVIAVQPSTPAAPAVGAITQPTCAVSTGSAVLNGLPSTGTWTLTRTPGGTTYTGTGLSTTIAPLASGTYSFTVTIASGCTSAASNNVVIASQPATPTAPQVGAIIQPTCTVATGSVAFNGLPSTGTWTLTRTPGGTTTGGTGASTTVSGVPSGTFTYTVTNSSGCSSPASNDVVIAVQPSTPAAPAVGAITQPTCTVGTGSVVLNGLPSTGTWTLTRTPGGTTSSGTGISTSISPLTAGTYTFTVTNASGCISAASNNVVIDAQPLTPAAPLAGTITQPTCTVATGSVAFNGLPSTGTWTLTRTPGGTTTGGTGASTTVTGVPSGTFTYTVTNSSGCTSPASNDVVIAVQPSTPTAPAVGTITQPNCAVSTGSAVLNGLPSTGTWTITRTPGGTTSSGTGTSATVSLLPTGTYTFTVSNASGCTSSASGNVVIAPQPPVPTAPLAGTIIQPTCTVSTGSVVLNGLPSTGTWTLTRTPGGTTYAGTGLSTTIAPLASGTYTFTVTNASGCTSAASNNVVIASQPTTPTAPLVGAIVQPTCSISTGVVILNGLPSTGTWTLTLTPGGTTFSGTGISTIISALSAGTYTFTVANASGCTSAASNNVVISAQPSTPAPPLVGTITQPTCAVGTGSVVLNGLPSTGTWTLTRTPGGTTVSGTGISTTITLLAAGNYTYTVTNATGCTSTASGNVIISAQPTTPAAPLVGTITQPTCTVGTGSVVLNGLPSTGTWTLTRIPGGTTSTGTGATTTISLLAAGTYTYTVTNASGCTSAASNSVVITPQPLTPTAPVVGTITQSTCSVATGSVVLNGLPSAGTWTITGTPGGTTSSGTGTSTTISLPAAGTYTFTVTNSSGCTSAASNNVVISLQPSTPTTPVPGTITQPTCTVATGSVVLNSLPSTGTWTIIRTPGGTTTSGTGISTTVSLLVAGTYTFTVTNASGCISATSNNVVIAAQPATPTIPVVGTITQPTCSVATGNVNLSGLPASGTWTLTRTPGAITTTGIGISSNLAGIPSGTYTFTVTNASGCTSAASNNVVIAPQPGTPAAPVTGAITQPTCAVATGSVVLSGLPSTGTWTLTRTPGGTTLAGTGTNTTITPLAAGTYSFTLTNASGCTSTASNNVIITQQPITPATPVVGTITQPNCNVAAGSVVLNGLPSTGTWTLTRAPGGTVATGTGISTTISPLTAGTYNFTVRNSSGCTSAASDNVVITPQPSTPAAPVAGAAVQPTCAVATGSVVLSGLPSTGTWTLTKTPLGVTTTGTGTGANIAALPSGTHTFTVTNSSGCTSTSSNNVVVGEQPSTPSAPAIGTITQPTYTVSTGSVVLNGLPNTGTWTLTRMPGGTTTSGSGTSTTISPLDAGTYTFTVTNASGCVSPASAIVSLNSLKLFGPNNAILRPKDTLDLNQSGAGSISIGVESNADWSVSDDAVWFHTVKGRGNSTIDITFMENISALEKVAAIKVKYALNPEIVVYLHQKARISHLSGSKFENVIIYPNPATESVYLNLDEVEYEEITVSIADIQGHTISSKHYNNLTSNQIIEMSVSGLPVGQYLVNISDGTDHKIFRIIKY